MIITFRFFFTESIKKRLQNSKPYLISLSHQLMELWEQHQEDSLFFGVFNENSRLDKIEFTVWTQRDFDALISRFDKSWDLIVVNLFTHINHIPIGQKIEGFFADIKIDTETSGISVLPLGEDDEYDMPKGESND